MLFVIVLVFFQEYVYPTMDEMAECVEDVFQHFQLNNAICFGVGAGANVFIRLGLMDPKHVECLILINGTMSTSSWSEWGYEKVCISSFGTFLFSFTFLFRIYIMNS